MGLQLLGIACLYHAIKERKCQSFPRMQDQSSFPLMKSETNLQFISNNALSYFVHIPARPQPKKRHSFKLQKMIQGMRGVEDQSSRLITLREGEETYEGKKTVHSHWKQEYSSHQVEAFLNKGDLGCARVRPLHQYTVNQTGI